MMYCFDYKTYSKEHMDRDIQMARRYHCFVPLVTEFSEEEPDCIWNGINIFVVGEQQDVLNYVNGYLRYEGTTIEDGNFNKVEVYNL